MSYYLTNNQSGFSSQFPHLDEQSRIYVLQILKSSSALVLLTVVFAAAALWLSRDNPPGEVGWFAATLTTMQ